MPYQDELLTELLDKWDVRQLDDYILQLVERRDDLEKWISHVKGIRRKKVRRVTPDNGTRGGK